MRINLSGFGQTKKHLTVQKVSKPVLYSFVKKKLKIKKGETFNETLLLFPFLVEKGAKINTYYASILAG